MKNLIQKINKKFPLSLIATASGFLLVLLFSWIYFVGSLSNNEEQIHSRLQEEFQILVSNFVAKKHPEVKEIIFHRVWTKDTANPDQIKVFFHYSLMTTGPAGGELLLKGESLLEKSMEQNNFWIAKNFKVTNSAVEFSEPLLIKASQNNNKIIDPNGGS